MLYPAKVMRASDLEKHMGLSRGTVSRLVHFPGQKFAWKNGKARNSPVLIDTEAYEKWRFQQIKISQGGTV